MVRVNNYRRAHSLEAFFPAFSKLSNCREKKWRNKVDMEISPLFIPLSLSLSLLDTLHYPCEDNSFFLFSSILNHLIALLLRFTGSSSITFPKKPFLNKNYSLIDTLKDNILK